MYLAELVLPKSKSVKLKTSCTYLPTYLPTCLPTCLPAYLPTYLPTYLPWYGDSYPCLLKAYLAFAIILQDYKFAADESNKNASEIALNRIKSH